ncbi:MAG: phosphotransferase [Anaerolineae bacterium]|nr:phosphotransferase [Anaerolineae bacterium]
MLTGKPIALGRTAEIYAWSNNQVIKLFYGWFPEGSIRYEAKISRAVYAAGLPVPAVGDVMEIDGRFGLIYERIDGISMFEVLSVKPWRLLSCARSLAELHTQMHHDAAIDGIPSQKERLGHKIRQAKALKLELKEAALTALEHMPVGTSLCHGDFHPGNVLITTKGPVIIDWVDATIGNPIADLARTSIIVLGASQSEAQSWIERIALDWFHSAYLKRYLKLNPGSEAQYRKWLPIVAAGRMSEGIDEIEAWLCAQVRAGLS